MTTQLLIYQTVLRELGQRTIASLSATDPGKVAIDEIYSQAISYCLEEGQWHWATRTVAIDASTDVTPAFGFDSAFPHPDDYVRTIRLSAQPTFYPPLSEYADEHGYIYANGTIVYLSYVSNDTDYGLSLSAWPETFTRAVCLYMASTICARLGGSDTLQATLEKKAKDAMSNARSKDALNQPWSMLPPGSWTRGRQGRGDWSFSSFREGQ